MICTKRKGARKLKTKNKKRKLTTVYWPVHGIVKYKLNTTYLWEKYKGVNIATNKIQRANHCVIFPKVVTIYLSVVKTLALMHILYKRVLQYKII